KHSLTKSLSLDHKKVARSKVTDNFERTELTFERRPRVKKMVTIKLEEAFMLIPLCTGEDDIYTFINACDMAVNFVEKKFAPTLVKN
ncbi:myb-like protein D, partial [Aphis craccivora]